MPRPKAKDPAVAANISLPRSLLRLCRTVANTEKVSLSAWFVKLLREHFQAVERGMR